ncbi:hypothetical protein KCP77_03825 [Salmonella enterica subsp. enterica]|nr:hypothetical protein KCP77_03825 [Salmonella enterica subsp. enterica]
MRDNDSVTRLGCLSRTAGIDSRSRLTSGRWKLAVRRRAPTTTRRTGAICPKARCCAEADFFDTTRWRGDAFTTAPLAVPQCWRR